MTKKILILLILFFIQNSGYASNMNYINYDFFQRFNDEYLDKYIKEAINNNHTVRQASARVMRYRKEIDYNFSKELPTLSVGANYLGAKIPILDNFMLNTNAFILPFILRYEPDFLLKNRDKTKMAWLEFDTQEYQRQGVYLSLITDIGILYVNILQYDEIINKQEKLKKLYENILDDANKKFLRGIIDINTLNTSKIHNENINIILENYIKQREILLYEFATLIGISAKCIGDIERGSFKNFEYKEKMPDEISVDAIFKRPDILEAEKKLEKAKIDIRVAKKEFFPSFNITGAWVFDTISPGNFFSWESSLAILIAGLTQDIFQGGRKIANLKIKHAQYEELLENYKQTDLNAIKEVNSALYSIKSDTKADENEIKKLNFTENNYQKTEKKYSRGVIANIDYYKAKDELLKEEIKSAERKAHRLVDYFNLYKALGGNL